MDALYNYKVYNNFDEGFYFKIKKNIGKFTQTHHVHEYYQLWYVLKGSGVHFFNQKKYELKRGDIFIMPPGIPHYVSTYDQNAELIFFEFSDNFIYKDSSDEKMLDISFLKPFTVSVDEIIPNFSLSPEVSQKVENLLLEMLDEIQYSGTGYKLFLKANTLKILALVSREFVNKNVGDGILVKDYHKSSIVSVLEYIAKNYMKKLYINDMCKLAAMSVSGFSRSFKNMVGMTFVEYVTFYRVEKSKDFLVATNLQISEIAENVGFCDSAAYDRAFKKQVGLTPYQYRIKNKM